LEQAASSLRTWACVVPDSGTNSVRKGHCHRPNGTRETPIDHDDALPPPAALSQTNHSSAISHSIGRATDPTVLGGQKRKRSAIMTVTGENRRKKKVFDHGDEGGHCKGTFRSIYASLKKKLMSVRNRVLGAEREIPSETPFSSIGSARYQTGRIRR